MSERMEPALTLEEWADFRRWWPREGDYLDGIFLDAETAPNIMAKANDVLPDDDRRKITRADVYLLERSAEGFRLEHSREAYRAIAQKLAALLPPEPA